MGIDMPRRIAIVEDEVAIRRNFEDALRRQGYQVSGYGDRKSALDAFRSRLPDLVIIDVGLSDDVEGGFELCRELRSISRVLPIMFLTARDSDADVISGLRLGADDYLTKDISLPHLMARIIVLFRRIEMLSGQQSTSTWLERDDLRLSVDRMEVQWNGKNVPLTVTELWIVHSLARRPGSVRSRQQLMDDANASFDKLDTVYGAGYRWNGSAG